MLDRLKLPPRHAAAPLTPLQPAAGPLLRPPKPPLAEASPEGRPHAEVNATERHTGSVPSEDQDALPAVPLGLAQQPPADGRPGRPLGQQEIFTRRPLALAVGPRRDRYGLEGRHAHLMLDVVLRRLLAF